MLSLSLYGCAAASSSAPAVEPAGSSVGGSVVVHDYTAELLGFWGGDASAPLESQVDAFVADVAAAHPELYGAQVVGLDSGVPEAAALRERLRLYLPAVEHARPRILEVAASLPVAVGGGVQTFEERFPIPAGGAQIILTASLGSFDGMTAELEGVPTILLAVDGIALFHPEDYDVQPLLHHELFHLHHAERWQGAPADSLGAAMWHEGLATYVSGVLNPDASATEIYGTPTLVREVKAELPKLALAAADQLDSQDQAVLDRFLTAGTDGEFPQRCGYVLGALVAEELAKTMTLDELTELRGEELTAALGASLRELAQRA